MNHKTVHLLDLPDEILLLIIKNLGSVDVLYSLLGVNQRLDQMARSIDNTKCLDFSGELPNDDLFSFDRVKSHRFLCDILPQIHHDIIALTLDKFCMKRVLLACEYPNLSMIIFDNSLSDNLLRELSEESAIARLFQEQITHITLEIREEIFPRLWYTDLCACIFAMYTKLSYLNIKQSGNFKREKLFFQNLPSNIYCSSHLRTLIIDVAHFNDCLYLLDGRLDQLSSFTVNIHSIENSSIIERNPEVLSNLKEFSLTCYSVTEAYDCRILPLLRQMTNLNSLTLYLNIKRSTVIDGTHFNEKLLHHMLHLNTFIFHICTLIFTSNTNHFLSKNNIQNTFMNWKYFQVNCCIGHCPDEYVYSHIYSAPFEMNRFMYLTNNFRNYRMKFVTNLTLHGTRPFEHDFFQWIPRIFLLLKYLIVDNLTPQKKKYQIKSINDKQISSKISYPHLIRLTLTNAHIDYADQFLHHTNAHVPCLHTLEIQYEKLVTVTNNFTNDATRQNCGQLKQLIFKELNVYPQHFYIYFPFLLK